MVIRAIIFRLAAASLGMVLAFAAAEGALRIISPQRTGPALYAFDRHVGSIPIPNQHGRVTLPGVYSYTFSNDELGLRVTGVIPRSQARVRVLVLGDSFAYGVGVSDQQTFAYLLEQHLAQTSLPAAVLNAGNGGKGTDYAVRFFETIGATLRPHLTLLFFFPNDFVDNGRSLIYAMGPDGQLRLRADIGAVYRKKDFLRNIPFYSWLLSWSHQPIWPRESPLATSAPPRTRRRRTRS